MLLGRSAECRRIDALLERARGGESGVLVLRGDPGIGKTALLDYAAGAAGDGVVLRARGVESEVELAFAGLHELLRPALDALGGLPAPHGTALGGALGLAPATAADSHLVGAATLELLAEVAPAVVLIDDLQWLDVPPARAFVSAPRRLLADAVAVVLAVRAGESSAADGAGLEEAELAGLAPEPARELLAAHAGRPVRADTAAWLHAATGGNPLALVELAREAPRLRPTPVTLDVPVGARIERALGRRLEGLSAAARARRGLRGGGGGGGGARGPARRRRGRRGGPGRGARRRGDPPGTGGGGGGGPGRGERRPRGVPPPPRALRRPRRRPAGGPP